MTTPLRAPLILSIVVLLLAVPAAIAHGPDPVRIACVGDSITEGTANADHHRNGWPAILGRLLDQTHPGQFETGNFGRSGATLLRNGRTPYWDQDVYAQGLAFEPDIVIINLGTNDAVNANWLPHGAAFEADLRDLIDVYRTLDTAPTIWLSTLTPMTPPHPRVAECRPHRAEIERIITAVAAEGRLGIIDFTNAPTGQDALFPDGLHPNTAGNELMARAAYEAVTGAPAPVDPTIRPRAVEGPPHALVADGRAVDVRLGPWTQADGWIEGTGAKNVVLAQVGLADGDFHVRARLRMLGQTNSAAGFAINDNFFGFEGNRGTVFRNGPQMGGLRLLHPSATLWDRDAWIEFEVIRNDATVWFIVNGFIVDMALIPGPIERMGFDPTRSTMRIESWSVVGPTVEIKPPHMVAHTVHTPWIDISHRFDVAEIVRRPRTNPPVSGTLHHSDGTPFTLTIEPAGLPAILSGDGHAAATLPDGRLIITFRDTRIDSPTKGDIVAWVGTVEDLFKQREGEYTCRLIDNQASNWRARNVAVQVDGDGVITATLSFDRIYRPDPVVVADLRFDVADMTALVPTRGYDIPLVDLDQDPGRHVVVDREKGQYLGHVTTVLLEDGRTILAVYPKGHGKGGIVYKRSDDGGMTWSDRLATPDNWSTSREVPTVHRVIDPKTGKKRLIMWSGLYPARLAVSEDDGATWSDLQPVGAWGGIVVMGFVERLQNGSYLAMFHDDGRFIAGSPQRTSPPTFTMYQTFSHDGGLTWTKPEPIWSGQDLHLCEPGCVRSPDGTTLAVLLRENSRTRNSHVIFSTNEGRTWTPPRELPASLTGDRHTIKYAPDGRLFICFRDTTHESPTQGDWVGWVGTWEDIRDGRPGQYRIRFKDNKHRWDTTYPGVEVLPDGTFVVTTYGHWDEGESPYILSARFTLAELDERAARGR